MHVAEEQPVLKWSASLSNHGLQACFFVIIQLEAEMAEKNLAYSPRLFYSIRRTSQHSPI